MIKSSVSYGEEQTGRCNCVRERLVKSLYSYACAHWSGTRTEGGVSGLSWLKIPRLIVTALSPFLSMAKRHLEWILC